MQHISTWQSPEKTLDTQSEEWVPTDLRLLITIRLPTTLTKLPLITMLYKTTRLTSPWVICWTWRSCPVKTVPCTPTPTPSRGYPPRPAPQPSTVTPQGQGWRTLAITPPLQYRRGCSNPHQVTVKVKVSFVRVFNVRSWSSFLLFFFFLRKNVVLGRIFSPVTRRCVKMCSFTLIKLCLLIYPIRVLIAMSRYI